MLGRPLPKVKNLHFGQHALNIQHLAWTDFGKTRMALDTDIPNGICSLPMTGHPVTGDAARLPDPAAL
jgi:hypothetical protein